MDLPFQSIFLLTGIIQTLGTQWLYYEKAADSTSFLTVLCMYLGMWSVRLIPVSENLVPQTKPFNHKTFIIISVFEVFGHMIVTAGMFLVGSGLYQVIYSSVVVFNAIFTRIFLARILNKKEWLSILVISGGLSLQIIGSTEPSESADGSVLQTLIGLIITLAGTALVAAVYTMNDYFLTHTSSIYQQPTPREQCYKVGFWCSVLTSAFIIVVSLRSMQNLNLGRTSVVVMHLVLILASFGHSITYFELLKSTGAVSTGVLQALRAILVFASSHFLYCKGHNEQCFNGGKWASTIIVVAGVLGYALAKQKTLVTNDDQVEFKVVSLEDN